MVGFKINILSKIFIILRIYNRRTKVFFFYKKNFIIRKIKLDVLILNTFIFNEFFIVYDFFKKNCKKKFVRSLKKRF